MRIPENVLKIIYELKLDLNTIPLTGIANLIYTRRELAAQALEIPGYNRYCGIPGQLIEITNQETVVPEQYEEDFIDYIERRELDRETAITLGIVKTILDKESYISYRCSVDTLFNTLIKCRYGIISSVPDNMSSLVSVSLLDI